MVGLVVQQVSIQNQGYIPYVLGATTPLGSVVDQKFIDTHNRFRLNKESIKQSMNYHSDYHMKVVVNPVERPDVWAEIRAFMDELEVPKNKIWIMPPGDNRQELIRVYPMVIDWCTKITVQPNSCFKISQESIMLFASLLEFSSPSRNL